MLNEGLRRARTANLAARNHAKVWQVFKKDSPNDSRLEDSLLRYLDTDRKKPEWHAVILNFKKFGEEHGYDVRHYKQALDRWISFFIPSIQSITESMDPIEISQLLVSMYKPKSKFDVVQKEMLGLIRYPGEELESKIALLRSLANAMYKDHSESERLANIERILLNRIIQFTHGMTRKNAELFIEFSRRQGKRIIFENVLKGEINSERVYGSPTMPLQYSSSLNPATMVYNTRTTVHDYTQGISPLVNTNPYDAGSQVYRNKYTPYLSPMESVFNNNPNIVLPPQRPILQVPRPPHIFPRPQQIIPGPSQQIARPPTDQQVRPSRVDIERIRVPGELGSLSTEEIDPEILDETAFAQLSMDETFRDAQNFIDPVNQKKQWMFI